MAFNVRQMPADRAAAIEEGVEEQRESEREHERAAAADDVAREAARVAELRRQGLICEDSATQDGGDGIAQRYRVRRPGRRLRGRAPLGGGIRPRGLRWRREAQGRHVSRGAFRVYAIEDTSDRGPVSGPLSP